MFSFVRDPSSLNAIDRLLFAILTLHHLQLIVVWFVEPTIPDWAPSSVSIVNQHRLILHCCVLMFEVRSRFIFLRCRLQSMAPEAYGLDCSTVFPPPFLVDCWPRFISLWSHHAPSSLDGSGVTCSKASQLLVTLLLPSRDCEPAPILHLLPQSVTIISLRQQGPSPHYLSQAAWAKDSTLAHTHHNFVGMGLLMSCKAGHSPKALSSLQDASPSYHGAIQPSASEESSHREALRSLCWPRLPSPLPLLIALSEQYKLFSMEYSSLYPLLLHAMYGMSASNSSAAKDNTAGLPVFHRWLNRLATDVA
jgi:hypothetical protein